MNGVVYHGNNESRRLIEEHEFYYSAGGDDEGSDDGQGSADPGSRWVAKHPRAEISPKCFISRIWVASLGFQTPADYDTFDVCPAL